MIVRRIRNDELTHYGVKGMKWRHHKSKAGTWKDNLGGGHSSGGGGSYEDELKDRNKAKRNLRAIEQTKRKTEEVKNSFGKSSKSEKAESMKKDVQERIDKYLTKGEKSDRHRLNSKRKNRENTGKKQINDLKDKREKDKRNNMWALQKSYNRSVKRNNNPENRKNDKDYDRHSRIAFGDNEFLRKRRKKHK